MKKSITLTVNGTAHTIEVVNPEPCSCTPSGKS